MSVNVDAVVTVASKGCRGRQSGNGLDGIICMLLIASNEIDDGGFARCGGKSDESTSSDGVEFGGCMAMHAEEIALAERGEDWGHHGDYDDGRVVDIMLLSLTMECIIAVLSD